MNPNQTDNLGGRPEKYTPEEIEIKAVEFFKHCDDTKVINGYGKEITKPKTLSGLCLWLKVSKDYISEKIKDDRFSEILRIIKSEVENDIEEGAMIGKYNPTISALNLSANFNWRSKTEIDQNNTGVGEVAKKEMYNTIKDKVKNMNTNELNTAIQDLLTD